VIDWFGETAGPGSSWRSGSYNFSLFDTYQNFGDQYIVIFQRGVDPYSPLYETEYDLTVNLNKCQWWTLSGHWFEPDKGFRRGKKTANAGLRVIIDEEIRILFDRLKIVFKSSFPPGIALLKKKKFSNKKI
jgi:hypothetical protein